MYYIFVLNRIIRLYPPHACKTLVNHLNFHVSLSSYNNSIIKSINWILGSIAWRVDMKRMKRSTQLAILAFAGALFYSALSGIFSGGVSADDSKVKPVDFNREIRPI